MKTIFINNFRGFANTFVNLKQVNFLVGENSTGKSSFLSLLKIISDLRFWFEQRFNDEESQLGSFEDIVSINSKDRTKFQIGFYLQEKDKFTYFRIINFVNHDGLPRAESYITCEDSNIFHIRHMQNIIKYNHRKIDNINIDTFKNSIDELLTQTQFTSELKIEPKSYPIPFLTHVFEEIKRNVYDENKKMIRNFGIRLPSVINNPIWLAPIRTKPQKTYSDIAKEFSPEGEHTPYLLKTILKIDKAKNQLLRLLEKIGNEGSLFKKISIKQYEKNDISPFEVQIILDDKPLRITNVGYGVSQSLPIIVELLARQKNSTYIIQQPEVHLHPKAQASLGDLVYLLKEQEKKVFFIETHSDYMIDRYRKNIYRTKNKLVDSQVLFFHRKKCHNNVVSIDILEDGKYTENQPPAFRKFFINEEMSLLNL